MKRISSPLTIPILILMLVFTAFNTYSADISLTATGVTDVGGKDYSNTDSVSINYSVTGVDNGVLKAYGPGGVNQIYTNAGNGTASFSGLTSGDYTFFFDLYSGEVTISADDGEITIPSMSHTVNVTDPDPTYEVSVDVEDHPEQVVPLENATVTIPAGTVLIAAKAVRVIVDVNPPIISNTNLTSIPEWTNQAEWDITGNYADNFLGGTVSVYVNNGSVNAPFTTHVSNKSGQFEIPIQLFEGENTIHLNAVDDSPMHNSSSSATFTVNYDPDKPTTSEPQVNITANGDNIRDQIIGSTTYDVVVDFDEVSAMDTGEALIVEFAFESGHKISAVPENENANGWSGEKQWSGNFFIPPGQGNTYDGKASMIIKEGSDVAGNSMPIYTENNMFTVDTTAPATISSPPFGTYLIEMISPEDGVVQDDETILFTMTDVTWKQGSGIDSAELTVWVDANGNNSQDSNELLKFNDTAETVVDGTSQINSSTTQIAIDPTKLPFEKWSGKDLKIKVTGLQDTVAENFGGPNKASDVSTHLTVEFSEDSRPRIEFVEWQSASPEITATPPLDPSLSPPIPLDPDKLFHTPFNTQQIKFNLIPAGDVTASPMFRIDTKSVLIIINGKDYNISGTQEPHESPALTFTDNGGTLEVVYDPSKNPHGPLPDGFCTVKVASARDLNGTSAVPEETAFVVDTTAPQISLQYPQDGYTTFDDSQEIQFTMTDTAPGQTATIEVHITNEFESTREVFDVRTSARAGVTEKELLILVSEDGVVKVQPKKTAYKTGYVDATITIHDEATNKSSMHFKFWMMDPVEFSLDGFPSVAGNPEISPSLNLYNPPPDIESDTRGVYVTGQVTDNNGGTYQDHMYFANLVSSGDNKVVSLDFSSIPLTAGENTIKATIFDNMGNKVNFKNTSASEMQETVVYDNQPPQGSYNLQLEWNRKSSAKVTWNDFTDAYSSPVKYLVELAVEESFSTIVHTKTTENTEYVVSLDDFPHSAYYIRVTAYDSLDNHAQPSQGILIRADAKRPYVASCMVQDNSPDSEYGSLYPKYPALDAEFAVVLTFSEEMDKTVRLSDNTRINIKINNSEKLPVENGKWVSDTVWVSLFTKKMFGSKFSGYYQFVVEGAEDVLGNSMDNFISEKFYLDQIPEIEKPKIFPNPLDDREILVIFRSLDQLKQNPHVTIDGEVTDFNLLANKWYGASYRIRPSANGIRALHITLTDIHGNTAHWPEDYEEMGSIDYSVFRTAVARPDIDTELATPSGNAKLSIYKNSVQKEEELYSMNYENDDTSSRGAPSMHKASRVEISDELEQIDVNMVFAPAITLKNNAEIEFDLEVDNTDGLVVMRKAGESWEFVESEILDDRIVANTDKLGTFSLFRDRHAPRITMNVDDGETIYDAASQFEIQITENGSGLKSNVVYLDGKVIAQNTDIIRYTPDSYLSGGRHEFVVVAEDNAGNRVEKRTAFQAPGFLSIAETSVYPNPASNIAQFEYTLDSVPSSVNLDIYDTSGRLIYRDVNRSGQISDSMMWDLTDKRGRRVANGMYYYIMKADGNGSDEMRGKIAIIR